MCSWAVIVCRDKSAYMTVYLVSLLSQQIPYTYTNTLNISDYVVISGLSFAQYDCRSEMFAYFDSLVFVLLVARSHLLLLLLIVQMS